MARKAIGKKTRFEVFKRDGFKCQYCGSTAPSVVLVIDHIEPVSLGGDNSVMNLITSCVDCNAGKSARRISDSSVIDKQRDQLALIQEQRNQLEMMKAWRDECHKVDAEKVQIVEQELRVHGFIGQNQELNSSGARLVLQILKKHNLEFVLECVPTLSVPDGDDPVSRLKRHVNVVVDAQKNPTSARWKYIYGILRNRFYFSDSRRVSYFKWAESAASWDIDPCEVEQIAKTCRSWNEFVEYLNDAIEAVEDEVEHESA